MYVYKFNNHLYKNCTNHAMEIVLLGLSLLLQIASFHVLQGAKRKRSHDELRNEAHYIALKWSACICGQIGGKIILRCMQSVCVYERENETESEGEGEREGPGPAGRERRKRGRECDLLSGPPNHLYSLATPIN